MDFKTQPEGDALEPREAAVPSAPPDHKLMAQRLVAKLRAKQQIEQVIAAGKLAEATTQIHQVLAEFPNDADILALEDRVQQARERSIQAYQLMEEGRQLCADQKFDEGIEVLRSAYSLDAHNVPVRSALIDNLLCQALAVLESNLPLAERLAQEANALDAQHPVNQSVIRSIQEYKQSRIAEQSKARQPMPSAASAAVAAPPAPPVKRLDGPPATMARPAAASPAVQQPPPIRPAAAPTPTPQASAQRRPSAPPMAPAPAGVTSPGRGISVVASGAASGRSSDPSSGRVAPNIRAAAAPLPAGNADAAAQPSAPEAAPKRKTTRQSVRPRLGPLKGWAWAACAVAIATVIAAVMGVVHKGIIAGRHAAGAPMAVSIRTVPAGATVRINGELYDIAQPVALRAGKYHVEASLDGYQPAARDIDFGADTSGPIELQLLPVAPMLQIATNLSAGTVTLDGQAAGELQNGQFSVASLAVGSHLLRVAGGAQSEAVIQFAVSPAGPPVLTSAIGAKNLSAVVVGSYGEQGRVYASVGPAIVRLDGNVAGSVAPADPVSLNGLSAASHELLLGDGKTQQKIAFDAAATAGLLVSLSTDRNVGALEIVSNEPGFDLRIDGKPAKVSIQRGRYFVYNIDAKSTSVQVSKAGFDVDPAEQVVEVRKGITPRVAFKWTPTPTRAALHLAGLLPGTRVVLDERAFDAPADGVLQTPVSPGEHSLEMSRPGYKSKTLRFSARAGQTIAFAANEVSLKDAATGRISIPSRTPAAAVVVLRKENAEYPVNGREAEIPEGLYTLVATAAGFREQVRSVKIAADAPATLDVKLLAIPQPVRMEGWDDAAAWKQENGWYSHKGGNFVMFRSSSPSGTVEFIARRKGRALPLFKGGQVRWVANYVDARNYDLYELDGQKLSWQRFVNGQPGPAKQAPHGIKIKDDTYRVMLDVGTSPETGKIFDGSAWRPLPVLAAASTNSAGRFGFYLPGNDELWLSGFVFKPAE
jgi:PEGA domain-containing protein